MNMKKKTPYELSGTFAKNKLAKRVRHLKLHPNDKQSEKAEIKEYARKRAMNKGNFPPKKYGFRDKAGNLLRNPSFSNESRKDETKKPSR
jgi:hypothetical protein